MARVTATTIVPGRVVDAEELWYDRHRWAAWVDGFGHIAKLEGEWPERGARLVWDSPPRGRGRVVERVLEYAVRAGSTVAVEDGRLHGTRTVRFEPEDDGVRVSVTLDYELKERTVLTRLADPLFTRRDLRASLRRTLERFAHERRAEVA